MTTGETMTQTTTINVTRQAPKGGKKGWWKVLTGIDRKARGGNSLVGSWLNDGDNEVPVGSVIVEGYYKGRGQARKLFLNVTRATITHNLVTGIEKDIDFSDHSARPQIWDRLETYLANGQSGPAKLAPKPAVTQPTPKPSVGDSLVRIANGENPDTVRASVFGSNTHHGIDRFSEGALVAWNSALKADAQDPQDVRDMALAAGLPEEIVPDYAGDRAIISRVIDRNASRFKRKGWVLSALKRHNTHVLMTIHKTDKDVSARTTDLPQVGELEWTAEPKDPKEARNHYNGIISGHEVGRELDDVYQALRGKITGTDWTSTLVSYLTNECYAQAWREDGRIYWVPPIALDKVRELKSWLATVGVNLAMLEIDPDVRSSVQEVVEASLVDQLDDLASEVDAFDGKQKPSTYSDRLEKFHALRKRAIVHCETLGIAKDTADAIRAKLDEMEVRVEGLLEERKQVRVKRDGTIEIL